MNQQNFSAMRDAMVVSQLRTVAVNDPRVIAALKSTPRERFVPDARAALAYVDTTIPLGDGRAINTPLATARLITEAEVRATDHVLLIGAATGYTADVLAQLAASVVAVEHDTVLAAAAQKALNGRSNATLVTAPLADGAPQNAPYDLIVIDGAVEFVPPALLAQLKVGGRMTTGIIERGVTRLALGHKSAGGFALVPFIDAECVVLPGFAKPKVFQF